VKVLFLTNEYPPHIYGGAGVHVGYLSRELAKTIDVDVRCFGDQNFKEGRLKVTGFELDTSGFTCPKPLQSVFGALRRDIDFNTTNIDADLAHCHTWYSHFGGILAKLNYGIPLVVTTHSLEPLRPWKREQLAGGYDFSLWVEKTALEMADAIIAVSAETKRDIERLFAVDPKRVQVIHNGIDPDEYHRVDSTAALERHGIDPKKPYLLFVGRIARQKGIIHLVRAIPFMDPDFPIVLCAGAPDTPEIAAEIEAKVARVRAERGNIIWIDRMLAREEVVQIVSHATVFLCPSIYEPLGIVNLEAMACETAVVATRTGGIPEVVEDGVTGLLVPFDPRDDGSRDPLDAERFARDIAERVNELLSDPARARRMGEAGRARAIERFSWPAIASETAALYGSLLRGAG
jgi:glycogen synthase